MNDAERMASRAAAILEPALPLARAVAASWMASGQNLDSVIVTMRGEGDESLPPCIKRLCGFIGQHRTTGVSRREFLAHLERMGDHYAAAAADLALEGPPGTVRGVVFVEDHLVTTRFFLVADDDDPTLTPGASNHQRLVERAFGAIYGMVNRRHSETGEAMHRIVAFVSNEASVAREVAARFGSDIPNNPVSMFTLDRAQAQHLWDGLAPGRLPGWFAARGDDPVVDVIVFTDGFACLVDLILPDDYRADGRAS